MQANHEVSTRAVAVGIDSGGHSAIVCRPFSTNQTYIGETERYGTKTLKPNPNIIQAVDLAWSTRKQHFHFQEFQHARAFS